MAVNFEIKDRNDVYTGVGHLIEDAQDLERVYKEVAMKLNLKVKNISKSSLNKLNDALKKANVLDERMYKILGKVIEKRNYINHYFFVNDFYRPVEELADMLDKIQFLIYEATDVISNIVDRLDGKEGMRPTVFGE